MPSVAKALRLPRVFQRSLSSKPSDLTDTTLTRTIRLHTELSVTHLTPELRLHLITPNCTLWRAPPSEAPFADPYWAFYWPGGQAIARYILDHPAAVRGRRVLDLGAGSGACGIAAAIAGAQRVLLNDIDPVACVAARLNLQENLGSYLLFTPIMRHPAGRSEKSFTFKWLFDMDFSKARNPHPHKAFFAPAFNTELSLKL